MIEDIRIMEAKGISILTEILRYMYDQIMGRQRPYFQEQLIQVGMSRLAYQHLTGLQHMISGGMQSQIIILIPETVVILQKYIQMDS